MDFRRALLSIALGLLLLLIWQAWVDYDNQKNQPQQVSTAPAAEQTQTTSVVPDTPESVPDVPATSAPAAPADQVQVETPTLKSSVLESDSRISVTTDLLQIEIDTHGGDLRVVNLSAYPVELDTPEIPFELINEHADGMLIAQSGLIGSEEYPNHRTRYTKEQDTYRLTPDQNQIEVPLHYESADGVRYTKLYTFYRDSYLIDITYSIVNSSTQPWAGYIYGQYLSTENTTSKGGFLFFQALPSYRGAAIYTPDEKYEKIDYGEIRDESLKLETPSGWVAMLQHYFVTAWLPQNEGPIQLYTKALAPNSPQPRYQAGYLALTPTQIPAGASAEIDTQIYVGPKEQSRIRDPAEGLILTVDYGWLTPVSSPLFWILQKINDFVGNWGWSIILLTLLVKLVFYPLSAASYKSMAKMKKLQPRLKTLKERYGDDKQKLNQEMMQIYKKDKINPLGGCLPILIQIPVFIALYWVLRESVELRQAPFALWLQDLSRADPFYVLPVLMGASMFAQQLLNPTPLDALQKNIMMSLPIVFTIFFLWFPSGLVLYWLVNNVLSIAQQWYITKRIAAM